jgi:hypothetical protein
MALFYELKNAFHQTMHRKKVEMFTEIAAWCCGG